MRLIDADALGVTDFELVLCDGDYKELCKTLIAKVESAPTVDAVPVVRCRECIYYKEGKLLGPTKFCYRLKDRNGEKIGYNFAEDDYCSHGQRREDGDA